MQKKLTIPNERCTHDVCIVSWMDAEEEAGWSELGDESPWIIKTIGFLVSKGRKRTDFIVMANSHLPWGDDESYSGITRIPLGMVIGVEVIARKVSCGHYISQDQSPRSSQSNSPQGQSDDRKIWKKIMSR